jgi:helicase MOV-10
VVKLLKNWRSHENILRFPNENFYGGELQTCGDRTIINSYLQSDILNTKGFPMIFEAIKGKDQREGSSPSFFNVGEATLVKQYVVDLLSDRRVLISKSRNLHNFAAE